MKSRTRSLTALLGFMTLGMTLGSCAALPEGEGTDKPTSAPTAAPARAACDALLGREQVDDVVRALGGGPFKVFSGDAPVAQTTESVAAVAAKWRPGETPSALEGSEVCALVTVKNTAHFSARVYWGPFSLDLLRAGAPRPPYEPLGYGLYVQGRQGDGILRMALPCKVRGAHPEQMTALPLGVQVSLEGADERNAKLRGEVASRIARQMVVHIPCENRPRIPDTLG